MHALCRSCEVQQETSELAQHGRAHGDMADLPLHPSVAQPLSPPAGDEDLNVAVGYRIGVVQGRRTSSGLGKAMRRGMRCWHQPRLPPPLWMSRANISRALLTGTSIPHSLLRRSSFWGLRLKGQSPPPTALRLFLSPLWRRKEETGVWESKERGCHQAQASAINHRWGVRRWGLESGWVQQGPKLLVETLRSFHVYSNIINVMGKNYFPSFLMNNLYPEHSFPCCVPPCLL